MNSETTAAAAGKRGVLRADPFAMRPFCGYNMADYFKHWLSFTERTDAAKLPKIFHVNWFRKSPQGKFLWPGFGDNIRVLKWIFERCDSTDKAPNAVDSPIGYLPAQDSLDLSGLNLSGDAMSELFRVNKTEWSQEVTRYREFQHLFGDRVPPALKQQLADLEKNISHLHY
eukprot:TRINITY_DN101_c0_g1_i4.p1 TRINITY_DN101_c0_g1~~TRINITY_DN101_c0_g1_i4.p1  ORF type:complete len:171 (-),score=89.71 TRINITY_DN101_c0_g1_i4:222-734(-)